MIYKQFPLEFNIALKLYIVQEIVIFNTTINFWIILANKNYSPHLLTSIKFNNGKVGNVTQYCTLCDLYTQNEIYWQKPLTSPACEIHRHNSPINYFGSNLWSLRILPIIYGTCKLGKHDKNFCKLRKNFKPSLVFNFFLKLHKSSSLILVILSGGTKRSQELKYLRNLQKITLTQRLQMMKFHHPQNN